MAFNFGNMLSGAVNSFGGGGANDNSGGGGGSNTNSGGIGGLLGGALSLIPGGGLLSGIGGMFSPGGMFGPGIPGHENADADRIANAIGITRQNALDLCGMVENEAGKGGPNFDDIVKDYAGRPQDALELIPRYNRKNPNNPITPRNSSAAGTAYQTPGVVSPYVVQTFGTAAQGFAPVIPRYVDQSSMQLAQQAQAQQFSVGGLGTAVLTGAQTGATDYLMDTPQGKAAKNEGAISWVKDNVVYFILGGIALGALIFKAFFSKK